MLPGCGRDAKQPSSACRPRPCSARNGSTRAYRPSSTSRASTRPKALCCITTAVARRDQGCSCHRCSDGPANCLRSGPPVRTNTGRHPCRFAIASDGSRIGRDRRTDRRPSWRTGNRAIARSSQAGGSGAESPQETRTRLLLTDAGLRPRQTQIDVLTASATMSIASIWAAKMEGRG